MTLSLLQVSTGISNALIVTFIVIFVATAILTLASLPNWIKMDEWYKKKLFAALILEVVGMVLILAKGVIDEKKNQDFGLPDGDWIALYDTGSAKRAIVKTEDPDTGETKIDTIGKEVDFAISNLKLKLSEDKNNTGKDLLIMSNDSIVLGKISKSDLKKYGLFNFIPDVSNSDDFARLCWDRKNTNSTWTMRKPNIKNNTYDSFLDDEVKFEIFDEDGYTKYNIISGSDTLFRASGKEFAPGNRRVHLCSNSKNEYFLFHIAETSITGESYESGISKSAAAPTQPEPVLSRAQTLTQIPKPIQTHSSNSTTKGDSIIVSQIRLKPEIFGLKE